MSVWSVVCDSDSFSATTLTPAKLSRNILPDRNERRKKKINNNKQNKYKIKNKLETYHCKVSPLFLLLYFNNESGTMTKIKTNVT